MEQSALDRGIVQVGNLQRMERVMKKAAAGKPITIGFLGGSITQDCAATKHENCYAYRTYQWFCKAFPESQIRYCNAGIGATDSQFGAARAEEDLLCEKPDLVFCEFSVNDANTKKYQETFEGVVRRILFSEGKPALFIFNNVFYDTGENAQEIHNEIAQYYDLPVVSMKDSIYEEILLGNIVRSDITKDNLHPNDLGHRYLAEVITNLLQIQKERIFNEPDRIEAEQLPEVPLTANRYEGAKRYRNASEAFHVNGFVKDSEKQQGVRDIFKNGFTAKTEGAELSISVFARMISVQYRKTVHHPAPVAEAYVDGKKAAVLDANFDEDWGECLYLQDIFEAEEASEHQITIRLASVPAQSETDFYFVSVITI